MTARSPYASSAIVTSIVLKGIGSDVAFEKLAEVLEDGITAKSAMCLIRATAIKMPVSLKPEPKKSIGKMSRRPSIYFVLKGIP